MKEALLGVFLSGVAMHSCISQRHGDKFPGWSSTRVGTPTLHRHILCIHIRKVDLFSDMKFYRRHEINFSATWKTFLATWKSFGDMKFILPTWNHFCSDMSQFLATWNFIGDMKSFSRRHESILGDMKSFRRHEIVFPATWNDFGSDMSSFLSTWNFYVFQWIHDFASASISTGGRVVKASHLKIATASS